MSYTDRRQLRLTIDESFTYNWKLFCKSVKLVSLKRLVSVKSAKISQHFLPFLQASLFATVMEDILIQLRILAECNTPLRVYKTQEDLQMLRASKYGIQPPEVKDELEGIDRKDLGKESYKLNKLAADRNFLSDVISSTYLDLAVDEMYDPLHFANQAIIEQENNLTFLTEEDVKNRAKRREVLRNLRIQRNRNKSVIYENDVIIDGLKSKIEDATLDKEVRNRYIDRWQNARCEQNLQKNQNKESTPSDGITICRKKIEDEQRVHSEVELINNILTNEILTKVEELMVRYDKDIEAIDLKIQIQKNYYEDQVEKRKEIEEKLAIHDAELKAWLKFKKEREEARLYVIKMTDAAVAVQAWWRGLLVRLQMGPYKQRQKKPTKEEKKKKK